MDPSAFLDVCDQFRLGELPTEQPHPDTVGLAELARRDLYRAVEVFHRADLKALKGITASLEPLGDLVSDMRDTFEGGGRIFLCGCGATGRLALSLETLARGGGLGPAKTDRVMAFMAGGDGALIRSIESFEDYPEYGVRQLKELGFAANDLLVAITEGGETPFVIGACMEAARHAGRPPWFLFCNPPEILKRVAERSRQVLESERVRPLFLDTGPMALSGSTRLQAATVQMLAAGAALSESMGGGPATELIQQFRSLLASSQPACLVPFIEAEANAYARGDQVLYLTDRYGMTVLTDTTERSPTFSLAPFENRHCKGDPPSLCYLSLPATDISAAAWESLLLREPRTLEWAELEGKASRETLLGYDISAQAADWRARRRPDVRQLPYQIMGEGPLLDFAGFRHDLALGKAPLLLRHLILKCHLNLQSTLVMGRNGRFESNLMTCVRPSNYKLIDRAARYRQNRHEQEYGRPLSYREAVAQVFASLE